MIPHVVYQTWKTKDEARWTRNQRRWVSWWRRGSGWSWELHDDADCLRLMRDSYPELEAAYATLRPVEKADLWRICQLLAHGGLYCDFDSICRKRVDRWLRDDDELVLGVMTDVLDRYPRWRPRHRLRSGGVFDPESAWRDNLVVFHNASMACRPDHPLLRDVLRRITVNLGDPFFVAHDVGLICKKTGPGVVTDALEAHLVAHGTTLAHVGRRLRRTPEVRVGGVRLLDYGAFHGRCLQQVGMSSWQPRKGMSWLMHRAWQALL